MGSQDLHRPFAFVLSLLVIGSVGISVAASPTSNGLLGAFLGAIMIAIAAVDAQHFIIPDELSAAAGFLGLSLHVLNADSIGPAYAICFAILNAVVAAAPLWLLMIGYRAWRGRDGLGLGDVKLAAVAGIWLDWTTLILVIDVAALAALAVALLASRLSGGPLSASTLLPFGLFFGPAIWLGWLGETVLGLRSP